jgi:moderate conductance mechanosensitive channel
VSRELRERVKLAFDEEGIEIPFPQQTVWHKAPELSER